MKLGGSKYIPSPPLVKDVLHFSQIAEGLPGVVFRSKAQPTEFVPRVLHIPLASASKINQITHVALTPWRTLSSTTLQKNGLYTQLVSLKVSL